MDDKTFTGSVPPYTATASQPPPGVVSPMQTGGYDTTHPAGALPPHHDPYNQGPPPSHLPPGPTSPTQYPHQPIPPPGQTAHYDHPPAGSPPPQITHQSSYGMPSHPGQPQEKHEYYTTAGQTPDQHPGQQGIPLQPHQTTGPPPPAPAASVYHTVTPLHSLNAGPAPVDCPVCHSRHMTRTEKHSGNTVHAWAAVLCCCLCLGCIPYLMTGLKDTEHFCGHCGVMLATYKNSGHTDVHQHG